MSVQRITRVAKARKDQGQCSRCGTPLLAGTGYLWWPLGFRVKAKGKRCLDPKCAPKPSERETSLTATYLAAVEDFEEGAASLETPEEIREAVEAVGEAAREVAEQYREAADAWENGNEEAEERADLWEQNADDLEGWAAGTEPDDDRPDEGCEIHLGEPDEDCGDCDEATRWAEEWDEDLNTMREEALEFVAEIEA